MPGPLLVVDAPSLLYRAFFGLPSSITDGEGHQVNALLGFVNMTLRVIEDYSPRAVVCCFGLEAATYRVELHDGYHADRRRCPTSSSGSGTGSRGSSRPSAGRSRRRRSTR